MVHQSMENGSRGGRRIVYKESVDGVGGFPFSSLFTRSLV